LILVLMDCIGWGGERYEEFWPDNQVYVEDMYHWRLIYNQGPNHLVSFWLSGNPLVTINKLLYARPG